MKHTILKKKFISRRDGWDVSVRFTDSTKGIDQPKLFFQPGKTEPTLDNMAAKLAHLTQNIEDELVPEIQMEFTRDEIEDILKEKGYLTEEEKWEDLTNKTG